MVASFLFDAAADSTANLDSLLAASEEDPLSSPPLLSYGDGHRECRDYGLKGMRVSYSEAVDLKKKKKKRIIKEEEGSSCLDDDDDDDGDADAAGAWRVKQVQGKKLDYQEILNAWSDNQEVLKENTLGFKLGSKSSFQSL
ncbi:hypothetical protein WN943_015456 [Citrus x changshan-huyou]